MNLFTERKCISSTSEKAIQSLNKVNNKNQNKEKKGEKFV